LKLFYHPSSPYVRKVLVLAGETGLYERMTMVPVTFTPVNPNPQVARINPLNKVPALITDDGEALYDSRVICEYLDSLHPRPKMIPAAGERRWKVLRLQALADGLLDAAALCRYERNVRPPEKQWDRWIAGQTTKVMQALDVAEQEIRGSDAGVDLGQIALACALGWIEFRQVFGDIRSARPALYSWYDQFSERPSMTATTPSS
jgi:glutathione S-transferase